MPVTLNLLWVTKFKFFTERFQIILIWEPSTKNGALVFGISVTSWPARESMFLKWLIFAFFFFFSQLSIDSASPVCYRPKDRQFHGVCVKVYVRCFSDTTNKEVCWLVLWWTYLQYVQMHRAGCFCMHMFVSSEDPDPSLLHSGGDLVLHSPIGRARHCRNLNLHTTPESGETHRYSLYIIYDLRHVFLFISTSSSHFSSWSDVRENKMFKTKKIEGLYYNV